MQNCEDNVARQMSIPRESCDSLGIGRKRKKASFCHKLTKKAFQDLVKEAKHCETAEIKRKSD